MDSIPFSNYIVYADESGDTSLSKINPEFSVFSLVLCVVKKEDYLQQIVPSIQRLKFTYWGHDRIVLHEHELRKQEGDFSIFLGKKQTQKRSSFMADLSTLMHRLPYCVISATIDKLQLSKQQSSPENPYELALQITLKQLHRFLVAQGEASTKVHLIFESRGKSEDKALELSFLRILSKSLFSKELETDFIDYELLFATKEHNATGLQLADLIARPVALQVMRPHQPNKAFAIIAEKFAAEAANGVFPDNPKEP